MGSSWPAHRISCRQPSSRLLCSPTPVPGERIPAVLALLLNLYLALFLADAGISALDELGRAATGHYLLGWLRNPVAWLAVMAGPGIYLLAVLFRCVPRAVFVPLALFPPLMLVLGLPLAYWLDWPNYGMTHVAGFQVLLAAWGVLFVRRRTGGRWWLRPEDLSLPSFSLGALLRMAAFTVLVVLPGSLGSCVGLCERSLDRFTGGYVEVGLSGVELVERAYTRGDSTVRLLGMMHIGDEATYQAIADSLDDPDTLVLTEGVSDEQGLLGERMHYETVADRTGLVSQRPFDSYREGLRLRNADVDVSAMSERTQLTLRLTTTMFDADGLNLPALLELIELSGETTEADQELFWYDVIDLRNAVLIEHLEQAVLEAPVVVVPWGAAHLPAIEDELLSWGYAPGDERRYQLMRWGGS